MVLAQISLNDFRNHAATRIDAGPGMVVLAGPNGSGKTNILEAVSLLAPGRGLRGAALDTMVRQGAGRGIVSAEACPPGDAGSAPVTLGTAIEAGSARRKVRINGADASATALGEWLSLLWLTPAMDRLFVESASGRRRFLDRMTLALDPSHSRHASRYEAAMRARNRLLADDRPADGAWLAALEEQMAQHGAAVDAARHRLTAALAAALEKSAPADGFPRPAIMLVDGDGALARQWDAAALADALRAGRAVDLRAGRTLTGPHRTDLSVIHADQGQAAALCSTGEQKALLLSIIIGHGELIADARGARPILLLDEVAAHLDPARRAALFDRLAAGGGQVWMTGTEMALFDAVPVGATRISVQAGKVATVTANPPA